MSAETYSVPTPTNNGWLSKRYLGIPVVYLAGAVVAILVIVAYLGSKKNTTGATASTATQVPVDPYQTLNSTGTVTTSQPVYFVAPNSQNIDTTVTETNASWQKKAVEYLVSSGSTVGDAQGAVQAYITGQSMSYAQGALINQVVAKYGLPPTITNIGTVAPNPSLGTVNSLPVRTAAYFMDPASYKVIGRRADGGIYGILQDTGAIHEISWPEWMALSAAGAKYVQE